MRRHGSLSLRNGETGLRPDTTGAAQLAARSGSARCPLLCAALHQSTFIRSTLQCPKRARLHIAPHSLHVSPHSASLLCSTLSAALHAEMMDDEDEISGPGVQANEHASSSSSSLAQYVTCGDTITADAGCLMGHGTMQSEGKLIATVSGFVERVNKLISVRALHTRYGGEVGDVIVGRIMEVRENKRGYLRGLAASRGAAERHACCLHALSRPHHLILVPL